MSVGCSEVERIALFGGKISAGDLKPDAHRTSQVIRVAVISAKKHKRQRRKRQSVTAKQEKSQTPKFLTAILTLPNLT